MLGRLLKNYQKKLVNLSGSNRSLLLLRLSQENDLDLNELDYLQNKPSFYLVEQLVARKRRIPLSAMVDSRHEKSNKVSKQIQRIDRKDKFLFEEAGAKDLYVGWPFTRGRFSDGTLVRCPLLFFPVELSLEGNTWYLSIRDEEPISFNKSFLLAWQHYNGIKLTEELEEANLDGMPSDARAFRTELYELLKKCGIELHFNSDLFIDKLEDFRPFKSAEFSEETEVGKIKLFSEAVLGIFPEAGSYLVRDYDVLLEEEDEVTIEDFFRRGTGREQESLPLREVDLQAPLPLDASQEQAFKMVKGGHSIVVQGPPGTGKSQLICNLVSDYISRGKRVLVVCQKRAALDVVYTRLSQLEIGAFVALVHDFKADRSGLYQKIANQIDKVDEYKEANSKLNTVFLERSYKEACRRIDQTVEELEAFKKALFDEKECGMSIKELYLNLRNDLPESHGFQQYYRYFIPEKLAAFTSRLNYLLPYALRLDVKEYPWKERKSFDRYTLQTKEELRQGLQRISENQKVLHPFTQRLNKSVQQLWEQRTGIAALLDIGDWVNEDVSYAHFVKFVSAKNPLDKIQKWKKKLEQFKMQLNAFVEKPLPKSVPIEELVVTIAMVEKAEIKFGHIISRIRWEWASKEKRSVQQMLYSNLLPYDRLGITQLKEKLLHLRGFLLLKEELMAYRDFNFGDKQNPQDYLILCESIENGLEAAEKWLLLDAEFGISVTPQKAAREGFLATLGLCIEAIKHAESAYVSALNHFTEKHLGILYSKTEVRDELETLQSDFDALVEYDKLKKELSFEEYSVLMELVENGSPSKVEWQNVEGRSAQLIDVFSNAIRRAWISHIEAKYPILTAVSTPKIAMLEQVLNEAIEEKRRMSSSILQLKLREQVFKNEEFNRLGNRTTFRDLKHQVTKKKKVWPLRKLMDAYYDEIFYALPCWLVSPETVSAIFPMEKMFDLVIFDEASQCYAEKGIPSIARGGQIVIVGDSKQLSPSDLYKARFEDDDVQVPEMEIDSLLQLGSRYFPEIMLTEHYRSKSLDLIDFSNVHFYKNKLQLLPEYSTYRSGYKGIEYVLTPGHFHNQRNQEEAERVVDLCINIFRTTPEKQLGVITFNIHQQYLIQDLLQDRLAEERMTLPSHFWVKNIENIQGDEKDIIVFSIGYSPDKSGKMSHHFGSLNLEGGQNRLNVAVTRAREKIVVVSSILPTQMDVDNLLHEGPKLLKKYLEYALEVSENRFKPTLNTSSSFNPRWFLKEKLKWHNRAKFSEDLPFADLVEKNDKGEFVQLILTDDDKFFNHLSVKETFSYLPRTLRSKNWKYERRFSRNSLFHSN